MLPAARVPGELAFSKRRQAFAEVPRKFREYYSKWKLDAVNRLKDVQIAAILA